MNENAVTLTVEEMETYLNHLEAQGRTQSTIQTYRRSLKKLGEWLDGDEISGQEKLARWCDDMLEHGYSPNTVATSLSIANNYLDFRGRRDLQITGAGRPVVESSEPPRLTRREYLDMLQAARSMGRQRVFLLINLFAQTGLGVQELPAVTVEAARLGCVRVRRGENEHEIELPCSLAGELLGYCAVSGITSGSVFVTRSGEPMSRTSVSDSIRLLCERAGLNSEKGNPRCLRRLYQDTQEQLRRRYESAVKRDYDALIEREQKLAAWRSETFKRAGSLF